MARILIVDDDGATRLLERTFLEKLGHDLHFAKDGAEALTVMDKVDIDVVVTDMVMPNVDGLSLIHTIRRMNPRVGVVAVSGVSRDELGLAQGLGAIEALAKPVDPEQFVEAVKKAVLHAQRPVSEGPPTTQ